MLSDEELQRELIDARAGDSAARGRVVTAIRPRIQMMIRVRLGALHRHWDLVEDLTQDVQLAIDESWSSLRTEDVAGFRLFVSRLVRSKVVDHFRRERRQPQWGLYPNAPSVHTASSAIEVLHSLHATTTSPSKRAVRSELVELLFAEVAGLSDRQREALTMAFFDELETAQIGEQLGISRQAAAMLVLRSVRSLRDGWLRKGRKLP